MSLQCYNHYKVELIRISNDPSYKFDKSHDRSSKAFFFPQIIEIAIMSEIKLIWHPSHSSNGTKLERSIKKQQLDDRRNV